jgi:putative serine/threonine protein kinase
LGEVKTVELSALREDPYRSILCYPRFSVEELERRVSELSGLGISALEFRGSRRIFGVGILGKGCVGIVVLALRNGGRVAVKILRTDADRNGFDHESSMLKLANSVDVGPRLLSFSSRFLVMEYLDGMPLPQWVMGLTGRGRKARLRRVLASLLEKCYRLDQMRLDHGELSRAPKHIIVEAQDKPEIVDFETASTERRPSNVTSLCQYLLIGSDLSAQIRRILGPVGKRALITALRRYKKGEHVTIQPILQMLGCDNLSSED